MKKKVKLPKWLSSAIVAVVAFVLGVQIDMPDEMPPTNDPSPMALKSTTQSPANTLMKIHRKDSLYRIEEIEIMTSSGDTVIRLHAWQSALDFQERFNSKIQQMYYTIAKLKSDIAKENSSIQSFSRLLASYGLNNYSKYSKEKLNSKFEGQWSYNNGRSMSVVFEILNGKCKHIGNAEIFGEISPLSTNLIILKFYEGATVEMYEIPEPGSKSFIGFDASGTVHRLEYNPTSNNR